MDVILSPQLAGDKRFHGEIVVVLDVLRATSTIVTALGNKALQVIPVVEPEEAFQWQKKLGTDTCLIGGERKGYKVEGFDLGNSPREYSETSVAGKVVILCTTNGTKAINWAREAYEVIIGTFLNIEVIIDYLKSNCNYDITVICSGRNGDLSLEDIAGAGMIVDGLSDYSLTDKAKIARYTYEKARNMGINAFVSQTEHGQYLTKIGMEADIDLCAALNKVPVLPKFRDGVVRI